MSIFSKTMTDTDPQGSDIANQLDTFLQTWRQGMNERYELEHNSLDSSASGATESDNPQAQGRHTPGKTAATLLDTLTAINALTGMVKGSSAFDTTNNVLRFYNGSDWTSNVVSGAPGTGPNLSGSSPVGDGDEVESGTAWASGTFTVANILDQSNATNSGTVTLGAGGVRHMYFDLGAEYRGWLELIGDLWGGSDSYISLICGYDSATPCSATTGATRGAHRHDRGVSLTGPSSSDITKNHIMIPFRGRYVGMRFVANSTATTSFIVHQFNVLGVTV